MKKPMDSTPLAHALPPLRSRSLGACTKRRGTHRRPSNFESGTGYAPILLASHASDELRVLLRQPRYDLIADLLIRSVCERAERCWASQSYWRARWRDAPHPSPLLVYFRHWLTASALRQGVSIPSDVREEFGMGVPVQRVLKVRMHRQQPTAVQRVGKHRPPLSKSPKPRKLR